METPPPLNATAELYIDLLKRCLTNSIYGEHEIRTRPSNAAWRKFIRRNLERVGWQVVRQLPMDPALREEGRDWPPYAHTMIGNRRLNNLHHCVADVLRRNVPGDLIETGVWRGGATILMRGILKAYGVTDRTVWVADSFAGLPRPNVEKYPFDMGDTTYAYAELAIPLERVQANFAAYGLLDDQVRFLKGWFKDTLPTAPVERLAVIRLDGDLYESTLDALTNLYPKLSPGGYLIVDDYGCIPACRHAVEDYRQMHGIREEVKTIDWTGVYWQRSDATAT